MQNKKILVIDDDPNLLRLMKQVFSKTGAQVFAAENGQEGLRQFHTHQPDLVIIDIMMPEIDGLQVCAQIRQDSDVPIMMLTALSDEKHIVGALECGAVEYVTKPFSPKILVARAEALLRHTDRVSKPQESLVYRDDRLTIDLGQRQVLVGGKPVRLSVTEYRLLAYLFQNAGQVLTFEQILEHVWGREYRDSIDYVHVYVSYLRRKLEETPKCPQYLLTEYGVGYRFAKQPVM